ncbi:5-methyltetrahydropteroyltriglutamate-homocysteine-S-methyltransferase [Heterostelium album PN500]|uniref:5-methyltetrahydropteroyltriglutamate--homocysteine S-methyltransferase n=1 Tax=Heterostelium pallidum (strain ATCC 26659 / Pp 5 / PN500) TaxID=670386 RepID=D3B8U1_HETP5|nr:5-methyltetrahydropteroyltriglutamate-homocysteine-S-methyltransferase [Heterostelium album PN500]EFA82459.1 5-methyltetrahydropteroyltriglutamate-homocysteine-S-methyltransferase [Heterostelium album PN500]|eukprot:XP_020434576.1 5-methyltetrahydropteroyltriglutamate-homocysteine-S-methyltransferase [Heterostelium album PN500]
MVVAANLGYPRMGEHRELKKLVESYWEGKLQDTELVKEAAQLRVHHWKVQADSGIQSIPSNDFSFYDQILDHILLFGVIPPRYQEVVVSEKEYATQVQGLRTYFAMGRGFQTSTAATAASESTTDTAFGSAQAITQKIDVSSLEMKKWFDTNYHYMVPEFADSQTFQLSANPKPVVEYLEAKAAGFETRPVLVGPLTFLLLGKSGNQAKPYTNRVDSLVHLEGLLPHYIELVNQLGKAGVTSIQFDEPILCYDLIKENEEIRVRLQEALKKIYESIHTAQPSIAIHITTYFGEIRENFQLLKSLPINSLHIDCVRCSEQEINTIVNELPSNWSLSLGLIDGRNIWKSDYKKKLQIISSVLAKIAKDRLIIAPSCSLLHSPSSLRSEQGFVKPEVLDWLAFAAEKLHEIKFLANATVAGFDLSLPAHKVFADEKLQAAYTANQTSIEARSVSKLIHNDAVKTRIAAITPEMFHRTSPYPKRAAAQRAKLAIPELFPTTTIGSFPQTREVRSARLQMKSGKITAEQYDQFIKKEIQEWITFQEECDLDILVHGEFERTDMVEYFGELLEGFIFTKNGWVQSYGSRCVKPPVIFGDVSRANPMTTYWSKYAQSLTKKPMKGMLTGPVTILQWSFVRDDQPRSDTCYQIALAIRDEVLDLEREGISVIQVDEAAIREGLPLRISDWDQYLKWAIDSFLLASTGVRDETQIHSHMCYSDFNDIFTSIQRMDTDVLTIENSKSDLKLLRAFEKYGYQSEIGPGLYDIHSPRIPTVQEMVDRLEQIVKYLNINQVWGNPDCGCKTRHAKETKAALINVVKAAKLCREKYSKKQ